MYVDPSLTIANFGLFLYYTITTNSGIIIELLKIFAISCAWIGALITWIWVKEKHNTPVKRPLNIGHTQYIKLAHSDYATKMNKRA